MPREASAEMTVWGSTIKSDAAVMTGQVTERMGHTYTETIRYLATLRNTGRHMA